MNKFGSSQYNIRALEGNSAMGILLMRATRIKSNLGRKKWVGFLLLTFFSFFKHIRLTPLFPILAGGGGQGESIRHFVTTSGPGTVKRNMNLL